MGEHLAVATAEPHDPYEDLLPPPPITHSEGLAKSSDFVQEEGEEEQASEDVGPMWAQAAAEQSALPDYVGVTRQLGRHKWRAEITKNKKQESLGHYDTAEEAAHVYDNMVREIAGERKVTGVNFPREGERAAIKRKPFTAEEDRLIMEDGARALPGRSSGSVRCRKSLLIAREAAAKRQRSD